MRTARPTRALRTRRRRACLQWARRSEREDHGMPGDRLMLIHSPEFTAMSQRVLQATALTSQLNALPFDDEAGKAALFEQILGRPLPTGVTIYPPFYTDHGLNLELGERVFINQNCTFL